MKILILFLFIPMLFFSCGKGSKIIDNTMPVGEIFSFYDTEKNDSVYYIATNDTCIFNDTIFSVSVEYSCETFKSLSQIIHKGNNCRINNSAAVAIARSNGNIEEVKQLNEETELAEKDGLEAKIQLQNHLDTCEICKRIHNTIDKAQ